MARNENMIAALKRERAIYVAAGDDDRIRQVDESLEHYGYTPAAAEEDGPKGRSSSPRQTADDAGGTDTAKAPAAKKTAERKTTATPPTSQAS
ncbi:hypothetical protein JHN59_13925 [Streptomyces sp. MBT49]|uniref:hypothetical protein n=1 Tax=Streptomyces sp. MBT49 TaxID=1488380 RepID=UPI00190B4959|nr:hypothetical protein [Streptomyces sp. MBT49]MBK3625922.1 hypothetical protein [Streptomyces sp. MBT49]